MAFQMVVAAGNQKIKKAGNGEADSFEQSIAHALIELEQNSELKAQLRELHITKAKEIDNNNKKVGVVLCLIYFGVLFFFRA